ncbi:MAG: M15 family metallopeptidase [bacterium]|nr:M15 family metallopeptidase [bacterium]
MLQPLLLRKSQELIQKCAGQGLEIVITEGFRSMARQNELYAQGRTKPGNIVTNARGGESLHNYGVAFDICFVVNGKRTYTGDWNKVGSIGESIGLEWGGRWKSFIDRPHFQIMAGYSLNNFMKKQIDYSKFN